MPETPPLQKTTHELGRIYDAIMDRKVLSSFFLETASRLLGAAQGFLFLSDKRGQLFLETTFGTSGSDQKVSPRLFHSIKRYHLSGKSIRRARRLFLPLIVRNHSIGIVCFQRKDDASVFSKNELETGIDLASEFSGAFKSALLYEENIRMEKLLALGRSMNMAAREITHIFQRTKYADMLIREGVEDRNTKGLEKGLGMLDRTMRDIDGFIWEALILSEDHKVERGHIDMRNLIEDLCNDLGAQGREQGIKIETEVEQGFVGVEGDGKALYRALYCLVKNAFEAFGARMRQRRVKITARMISTDKYELIVEDNASGMTPEIKSRLFEMFFTSKGKDGAGLGLLVVARAVKMHQGAIKVESQPGVGTKFILTLPRSFPK